MLLYERSFFNLNQYQYTIFTECNLTVALYLHVCASSHIFPGKGIE